MLAALLRQMDGLVIRHDIGELAGDRAGHEEFTETLTEGSRVRVARNKIMEDGGVSKFYSDVSIPDDGCANFYLTSPNRDDSAAIDFIARSFRPKGWKPSWLRPLLPPILRSDCRIFY